MDVSNDSAEKWMFTLGKAQVNLALLSLNRDCRMYNSAVCLWDVGRQRFDRRN